MRRHNNDSTELEVKAPLLTFHDSESKSKKGVMLLAGVNDPNDQRYYSSTTEIKTRSMSEI